MQGITCLYDTNDRAIQPSTNCVVGLIPADGALEVWLWTSGLNDRLVTLPDL